MNDGSRDPQVSLKLADGAFFPLYRRGDAVQKKLRVVPAREGQGEAELSFYGHPPDEDEPVYLGSVRFTGLPDTPNEAEIELEADFTGWERLRVSLKHIASGRIEKFEAVVPNDIAEDGVLPDAEPSEAGKAPKRKGLPVPARIILGILFTAIILAGILYLVRTVAEWGRIETPPAPVSFVTDPYPGSHA